MDRSDVRREWDRISETYADRRDPSGSDAGLIGAVLETIDGTPLALDVGCGDGARTLANLPSGSIGIDISRSGLSLAAETVPKSRLVEGEMTALPIADNAVDLITAYHSVFHVPRAEHPAVYREFARVLVDGGQVLMTLPGGRFETVRRGWMGGRMLFSAPGKQTTLNQLKEAGFVDIQIRTVDDPLGSQSEFAIARLDEAAIAE
ncbi:class I SAM-dependent methyltransferase [Halalkalirubrum salinum]|uniref:class I SAM-dependent methyltransferase n=1 Tax=Halalkalirubrum salinum TaxID=2563889 RepID=UPI0010FAEB0E|nr:class I SAM-dependent methyltransferase [Halalkalirubrum salinum]